MATGDGVGWRIISVTENNTHTITEITKRQIYWARYVDVSIRNWLFPGLVLPL